MAKTYTLIQAQTLTATAATVTFSNIPQNYTDLKLYVSSRHDAGSGNWNEIYLTYNGGTNSGNWRALYGTGAAAASTGSASTTSYGGESATANSTTATFSNNEIYIPNYTTVSTTKYFSLDTVAESNAASALTLMSASSMTGSSAAITSLTFTPTSGNFIAGSTFYLYGIGGTRATGGTITADANYTYHTFTSTTTFTALEKIKNAEIVMIAGGGAGGGNPSGNNYAASGGGGAGGVFYTWGQTLNAGTSYTALVGAGGTGDAGVNSNGLSGNDSAFGPVNVALGGGGGRSGYGPGASGGSGGGAGAHGGVNRAGGTSTQTGTGGTGYGNAGGANNTVDYYAGAGGGGAGAVGTVAPSAQNAGNGGVGTIAFQTWHLATGTGVNVSGAYHIAGGGGGGGAPAYGTVSASTGGSGGGGAGGNGGASNSPVSGTANSGGGGGGAGSANGTAGTVAGGSGGSGLVIVRYPTT